MAESQRLNKILALELGLSRRQADILIEKGEVTVNGIPARLGQQVTATEEVTVRGKPVTRSVSHIYLALNKPIGYVCSRRQQGESPTIYSLLPQKYHPLKPVGRLDKDSSGILLLTNDGDFALKMTHPRYVKIKQYEVALDTPLQPLHQQMISDYGITLGDGISKLQLENHSRDRKKWLVTMHEGRNRQIRRTFTAIGCEVVRLHRTRFGDFELNGLPTGKFVEVIPDKKL